VIAVRERRAAEEAKAAKSPPVPKDPSKEFPPSWDIVKAVRRRQALREFEQKPKSPADPQGPERDAANSVLNDIMDAVADQEFDKQKQQQQPVVVVVPVDPRLDHPAAKQPPLAVNQKPKPDHPLSKKTPQKNDQELEAPSPKSPGPEQQQQQQTLPPPAPTNQQLKQQARLISDLMTPSPMSQDLRQQQQQQEVLVEPQPSRLQYEQRYDPQDPQQRQPEYEHPRFERMIDHRGAEYDVPDLPNRPARPQPRMPDLPIPHPRREPRMSELDSDVPMPEPRHVPDYEDKVSRRDEGLDMPDLPYMLPMMPLPDYDDSVSSKDEGTDMPDLPYLLPIMPLPEGLMPPDESPHDGPDLPGPHQPGPESQQPSYGPEAYQPMNEDRLREVPEMHEQQRTDVRYGAEGLPNRADMPETGYSRDLPTSQPRDLPKDQGAQGGYGYSSELPEPDHNRDDSEVHQGAQGGYGYGSQGPTNDEANYGPDSGRPDDEPHVLEGIRSYDRSPEGRYVREQPLYEPDGRAESLGKVHAATSELRILYSGDGRDAGPEELGECHSVSGT
jgi:hypothetical protein